MSESQKSQQQATSKPGLPLPPLSDSMAHAKIDTPAGADYRVDAAHTVGTADAKPSDNSLNQQAGSSTAPTDHQQSELVQAQQLIGHLRIQLADLESREEQHRERVQIFEQKQRDIRLWTHQQNEDLIARENNIHQQEAELANRLQACEKLVQELEQQESALIRSTEQIDTERERLKNELQAELDVDRKALQQAQHAVADERVQLAELLERNAHTRDEVLEEGRREWMKEREELHNRLASEVREEFKTETENLEDERSRWELLRDAQLEELTERKTDIDAELDETEQKLAEVRLEHMQSLEIEREDHARRIEDEQENFEQEMKLREARFQAEQEQWKSQRAEELAEISRERELSDQATVKAEEELKNLEQQQNADLKEQQQQFAQARDQQQQALKQERAIFENRQRFQQDHLTKLRQELEQLQQEVRAEQQNNQLKIVQETLLIRLRSEQLAHYRDLLEERERSVKRSQSMFAKAKTTFENELNTEREQFHRKRNNWKQEQEAQQVEQAHQDERLALYAENLEQRKERLDHLRAEMEASHHDTLEIRMALEEAFAQFSQAAGAEVCKERVDEAREKLAEHYQHIKNSLAEHREELAQARLHFQDQQLQFREQEQKLSDWISERGEHFRQWEERLQRDAEKLELDISAAHVARDKWSQEKEQAEIVIRSLLQQISHDAEPEAIQSGSDLQSTSYPED